MRAALRSLGEWRGPASGRAAWLAVGLLALDVVLATLPTDFPNGSGVRYWVVWLVAGGVALAAASLAKRFLRPASPWLGPVEALAVLAVLAMAMTDITMAWQPLRDLAIYLRAGDHFVQGAPVYTQTPLLVQPEDRTLYPFLYPPPALPLFGALAQLPEGIAQAVWLFSSIGLGLGALRLFGLPARWLTLALLWPPLFQGVWVGNVAVPVLALFAVAPWVGAGLPAAALFKPYSGLAGLWLVRERRWGQLAGGLAMVALLALATLPLTGIGAWADWVGGLKAYQSSQQTLPSLYGFGLMRYLPSLVFVGVAVLALAAAAAARGTDSLARFGTATVVSSPSLFGHGLLVAVPSLLSLRSPWLWLGMGLLSTPDGLQWWWAIMLVAASWVLPAMRRSPEESDPLHPLPPGRGSWPDLPQAPGRV